MTVVNEKVNRQSHLTITALTSLPTGKAKGGYWTAICPEHFMPCKKSHKDAHSMTLFRTSWKHFAALFMVVILRVQRILHHIPRAQLESACFACPKVLGSITGKGSGVIAGVRYTGSIASLRR